MSEKRVSIQFNYKSGHKVVVTVDEFTVQKQDNGATLAGFKWEGPMVPHGMFINIDEIESVWELPNE